MEDKNELVEDTLYILYIFNVGFSYAYCIQKHECMHEA